MPINTPIVHFKEVNGLFILEKLANHAKSMEVLAKTGLKPLTYQEALSRSSELIKELRGKWFYLAGTGIKENGVYAFDERGELIKLAGNEMPDQKVRVHSGSQPLSLGVNTEAYHNGLFVLNGSSSPTDVAPVVVGVADPIHIKEIHRVLNKLRRGM